MKTIMRFLFISFLMVSGLQVLAAEHRITTQGWVFTPEVLTISVGDKVTWVNDDDTIHTVIFQDPKIQGNDKIKPEKEFSVVFNTPGEFPYQCRQHKGNGMIGKIIVKEIATKK